jgi:hypothetical protein
MMHRDIPPLTSGDRYREEGWRDRLGLELYEMPSSDEPSIGRIAMGIAVAYLIGLAGAMILF